MRLKMKSIIPGLDTSAKTLAIIDKYDANRLGVEPLDRIVVNHGKKEVTCVIDVDKGTLINSGYILLSNEVAKILDIKDGNEVYIRRREELLSKKYIRKKVDGKKLSYKEYYEIVNDIIKRNLNDLELTSFIIGLYINGMTTQESADLSMAMVNVGEKLTFNRKVVVDKHSIGGIPGDKTTILVVPTLASLGYIIPKTSSRAITDPAGTADREEVMMNVSLDLKKMKKVVEKTNGCMLWGGSLHMSPADDLIINIERPLRIDSVLLPSILSKKKAAGSKYVVIDIPTGPDAKIKTIKEAKKLAKKFHDIGKKMKMEIFAASTSARQPLGRAVGPALEAREAIENLMNPTESDLISKVTGLVGILISRIEKISFKEGRNRALNALKSGSSYSKFIEIANAQGAKVLDPKKIHIGKYKFHVKSNKNGYLNYISNHHIVSIAKAAGAPYDKAAGIYLEKKLGDYVRKGDVVFTIYSDHKDNLEIALQILKEEKDVFKISQKKVKLPKDMILKIFKW